jgi:hypothetical protein
MCQVLIHTPRLALCAADRNASLGGVIEKVVSACEALVEFGIAPWSNDFDGGLEGIECELETDLVVALSGAAVRNGNAAFFLGDFDLCTGNDRTGEGCA